MSARTRKHFSGPFKAKVALEAIRAVKTCSFLQQATTLNYCLEIGVHYSEESQR